MTATNAFWRLFPAVLFTLLGSVWCFAWRFDPALMAIALCLTALASSWLVITIVQVARTMTTVPSQALAQGSSSSVAGGAA